MKTVVSIKRNKIARQVLKSTFNNKFHANHLSISVDELCRRHNLWPCNTFVVLKKIGVTKIFAAVRRWCKCSGGRQWLLIGVLIVTCVAAGHWTSSCSVGQARYVTSPISRDGRSVVHLLIMVVRPAAEGSWWHYSDYGSVPKTQRLSASALTFIT